MKMKKRHIIAILSVILVLAVLLFPVHTIYRDGGTQTYTSLTYKIISWNTLDGKKGTEIHLFPNNFHGLSYYSEIK